MSAFISSVFFVLTWIAAFGTAFLTVFTVIGMLVTVGQAVFFSVRFLYERLTLGANGADCSAHDARQALLATILMVAVNLVLSGVIFGLSKTEGGYSALTEKVDGDGAMEWSD